ncbi:HAD hydrolase-like protein [Atopobium sp. oral taxon 416]|uniref:HAD hydrolase-like protein n=1 Tax=Atopobium sp. oral taxon 416 TaxID=712157 RepID=UPI001BA92B9D|nr:HAD hydrolase-like protein [Atopobium sp. oral taxon 416]
MPVVHDLHSRSVLCAIRSSPGPEFIEESMRATRAMSYVRPVISREECHEFKSSPEIYHTAMELLGVRARDCVVVEDSSRWHTRRRGVGRARVCALRPRPSVSLDQGGWTWWLSCSLG